MKTVHIVVGVAAISLSGVGGLFGAWCWWRLRASTWFWRMLRAAQATYVLEAALGGLLAAAGKHASSLHLVYGLLPLAVSFLAEQLRLASAQMVLDSRGFGSASEVGTLAESEQQSVVRAIISREMGVMVLALLVNVVLLARAAGT